MFPWPITGPEKNKATESDLKLSRPRAIPPVDLIFLVFPGWTNEHRARVSFTSNCSLSYYCVLYFQYLLSKITKQIDSSPADINYAV